MKKYLIQDIRLPNEKPETPRRIPVKDSPAEVVPPPIPVERQQEIRRSYFSGFESDFHKEAKPQQASEPVVIARYSDKRQKPRRPKIVYIAPLAIIVCVFFLSSYFSRAYVTITPKTDVIEVNESITAYKNRTDGVVFTAMTVRDEASVPIEESQKQKVERHAEGKVVIYNSYSNTSQKLLIDTRLRAKVSGKIYKTKEAAVVPGRVLQNGTVVPGSVEVGIYAEEAGEEYNGSPDDFSIVGFDGTPKATGFYARSVAEITGGFIGEEYTVSDNTKEEAKSKAKDDLAKLLLNQAMFEAPEGSLVYEGLTNFVLDENGIIEEREGEKVFTIGGSLTAFIIPKGALENFIVSKHNEQKEDIKISRLENYKFSFSDPEVIKKTDPANLDQISIEVDSPITLTWEIDEEMLASRVAGKAKKEFGDIIKEFKSIAGADLIVRPVWNSKVPDRLDRVIINIVDK